MRPHFERKRPRITQGEVDAIEKSAVATDMGISIPETTWHAPYIGERDQYAPATRDLGRHGYGDLPDVTFTNPGETWGPQRPGRFPVTVGVVTSGRTDYDAFVMDGGRYAPDRVWPTPGHGARVSAVVSRNDNAQQLGLAAALSASTEPDSSTFFASYYSGGAAAGSSVR